MEMHQHGLICATEDCQFMFFEVNRNPDTTSKTTYLVKYIAKWNPPPTVFKLDDMAKLFYQMALIDCKSEHM